MIHMHMSNQTMDCCDGEKNDSEVYKKEFVGEVKNIERYLADQSVSFFDNDVIDLFDLTLHCKTKKLKCLLHPKLNCVVYRGRLFASCLVCVLEYNLLSGETKEDCNNVVVINDVKIVESSMQLVDPEEIFCKANNSKKPLCSTREWYLPLYENDGLYGDIWNKHLKTMKAISENKVKSLTTLAELSNNPHKKVFPVSGTVVAKSRIINFAKSSDRKCNLPFFFSIEIQNNDNTSSVTFWNRSCLRYFKSIQVGQHLIIENYRLKNRYGVRSNTVMGVAKDVSLELSINEANPKGEVNIIIEENENIVYRFKTSQDLLKPCAAESIFDLVGFVGFIGRYEREKRTNSIEPLKTGDFWLYRWMTLIDGTSNSTIKVKLYSCSQNYILDDLKIGDVFVATRMLYKLDCVLFDGSYKNQTWFTTTRDSQFYKIEKNMTLNNIKQFPFIGKKEVVNLLKISRNSTAVDELLKDSRTGGYFSYPILPNNCSDYLASFPIASPVKILSTDQLYNVTKQMHVYERVRVCVKATVIAVECIDQEQHSRKYFQTSDHLSNCDAMERIGDDVSTMKSVERELLGNYNNINQKMFLRLLLLGLEKTMCIVGYFIPEFQENSRINSLEEILNGHHVSLKGLLNLIDSNEASIGSSDEFLFVLDVYLGVGTKLEVVVNRAYKVT